MLLQIIKNLIVLSNTSTNIGQEGVKLLLSELSLASNNNTNAVFSTTNSNINLSSNSKTNNNKNPNRTSFKTIVDESDLHLYHPLYLNNELNQYANTELSKPSDPNTKK
jgi:hypothetical protein